MANFNESYEVKGGSEMTDSVIGAGGGFIGGLVTGGLIGYALNNWNGNRGCAYNVPFVNTACGCGCDNYSIADVSNLVATKDAQYDQLNAVQQSRFEILNTMGRDNLSMAKDLCGLAYENAMLSNQVQRQISDVSAKSDLCCCQTQGMISRIVPEIKQFYLEDEVAKLRQINAIQNTNCGFDKVNMNLNDIECGIKAILNKLYEPTTTTPTA